MTQRSTKFVTSVTLVATLILGSPLAMAQDATATPTTKPSPAASARAEKAEKMAEVKAERTAKLEAAKLKVCQNREAAMQKRSTQLVKMTENMQAKFTAILNRVKEYYTGTLIPSGVTVANYDALLADITTKKAAVDTALAASKTSAADFSCTSDDPKGQLTTFREDMQAVKAALKAYRTSIKNLIVAVKGVAKATPTPTATTSATPTPTEE